MGDTHPPPSVTPLVAMLAGDLSYFQVAKQPLEKLLGKIAQESPIYAFDKTAYYTHSMGVALKRQFFIFEQLADPAGLVDWKLAANALELELKHLLAPSGAPNRPINLDPGYLMGSKLVLASTKNFAHRLYLRDGIFAEITLNFYGEQWVSHRFTFPDFKSGMYDDFLKKARAMHLQKLK